MQRNRTTGATASCICSTRSYGEICPAPAAILQAAVHAYVGEVLHAALTSLALTAPDAVPSLTDASDAYHAAHIELSEYLESQGSPLIDRADYADEARDRRRAVDARWVELVLAAARHVAAHPDAAGSETWWLLPERDRNLLLRGLFCAVVVEIATRGRSPRDRVRVLARNSTVPLAYRAPAVSEGIVPIPVARLVGRDVIRPRTIHR